MFSAREIERYQRQIMLHNVGVQGQEKLKKSSVLVIGAGGLGCPILQCLALSGVGTIGIVDHDVVEMSNLHRQVLYTTEDLNKNKALVAKNKLEVLNPDVSIIAYPEKFSASNAQQRIDRFDIIVDGSDNFSTRYLVNDVSVIHGKPFVYGAIHGFEGQVSVFNYQDGPTYRCVFPKSPKSKNIPNCSTKGVLGVLPGMIGNIQANEVLKMILGIGEVLSGKMLIFNALNVSASLFQIQKNDEEVQRVKESASDFHKIDYEDFCSRSTPKKEVQEISVAQLREKWNGDVQLIDVRNEWEHPRIEHPCVENVLFESIMKNNHSISRAKPTVLICQTGKRSKLAAEHLQEKLGFNQVYSLKNGIKEINQLT